ncbi:MAG: 4Fe-4S binding protein, partial [Candidatus Thorarchaeota archaeon]
MLRIVRRQRLRKGLIFTSFLLFPIIMNYFSPYLIIEAALLGIMNGSFIVFTLLFISSLFLGRGFCGWLCPAG